MVKWFGGKRRGSQGRGKGRAPSYRPTVEGLEERALLTGPAIDLPLGTAISIPVFVKNVGGQSQYFGKSILMPIATDADPSKDISFTIQQVDENGNITNNPNPNFTLENNAGDRYLRLTLEYKDVNGVTKTGVLQFELLPDLAPATVARFVDLANRGYFNNTIFHRIATDSGNLALALQAGQPGTGFTTPGAIADEFSRSSLFTGSGQLALAKTAADDSGTSQFFITTNGAGPTASTNPERGWSFNYPIFGQLVRGFDVRDELVSLPRTTQSTGTATFNNAVTIKNAEVITNLADDVITIRATGAPGATVRYLVTATDGTDSSSRVFTVSTVTDATNDAPFLTSVPSASTVAGQPATITLQATDLENDPLTYSVSGVTPGGAQAVVNGNQVTVTPPPKFTGTVNLAASVSDATHPSADSQATQVRVDFSVSPNLPADERFLIQAYRDILGRDPDDSGRDYFLGQMARGVSHQSIASQILNSQEGRSRDIDQIYRDLLGREADEAGRQAWLKYLGQGGTLTKLRAMVAGSDEFYQRLGASDRNFLTFAFAIITGQALDQASQQTYASLLASGTPRSVVAYRMMTSTEGWQALVGGSYQAALERTGDTAGTNYFVGLLQSWRHEEEIRAEMYGSEEYQSGIV